MMLLETGIDIVDSNNGDSSVQLEKKPTPRGPSVNLPERFSQNFNGHK
jgi:hypothetical protein